MVKVINKASDREKERTSLLEKMKLKRAEERALKKEKTPTIKVIPDWRMMQQFNEGYETGIVFNHQKKEVKENFLKHVINKRSSLNELIIEEYTPNKMTEEQDTISIEVSKDTYKELKQEARKINLELDTYIRSLFYTEAYNTNEKRKKNKVQREKERKENELFSMNVEVNNELKERLLKDYGEEGHSNRLMGYEERKKYYGDMAVKALNEHYGIKQ